MLVLETIAKVRRAYFVQKKPIKAICCELMLSRKVVRKIVRSDAKEFRYERETQSKPKIDPFRSELDALLTANYRDIRRYARLLEKDRHRQAETGDGLAPEAPVLGATRACAASPPTMILTMSRSG